MEFAAFLCHCATTLSKSADNRLKPSGTNTADSHLKGEFMAQGKH